MTATPSTAYANAGGFIPPALPSPAPSTASSRAAAGLPHPRSKPLVPGSRKEDYAREYVYRRLLHVSRRYVKKHSIPDPNDLVSAYEGFDEACKDLEEVVDVLWFSGTPSLQVPYLLNVALAITEYLPSFPPSPRPTFALLKKLDHCFASLLEGKDIRTHETLPGFENGMRKGMTRTDMVRLRSLADETRSLVAVKMSGEADVDTSIFPEDSEIAMPAASTIYGSVNARGNEDALNSDRWSQSPTRQQPDSPMDLKVETPTIKREDNNDSPTMDILADRNTSAHSGQFHWAVEDSDNDQDSDADQIMTEANDAQQLTPPPTESNSMEPRPVQQRQTHNYMVEDEEDQELHMSVAKVYEKTIVQLGRTLGETLIDE
ncbi:meiotic recombination protein DMC1 [Seiridium cupressi]